MQCRSPPVGTISGVEIISQLDILVQSCFERQSCAELYKSPRDSTSNFLSAQCRIFQKWLKTCHKIQFWALSRQESAGWKYPYSHFFQLWLHSKPQFEFLNFSSILISIWSIFRYTTRQRFYSPVLVGCRDCVNLKTSYFCLLLRFELKSFHLP